MRVLLFSCACLLTSCATHPDLLGSPGDDWMCKALAHPEQNSAYQRFADAYHGKRSALHAYFTESLRQAESPEINVEAGEALSWEMAAIIHRIGDARFAAALAAEPERTRSAVASCFRDVASPAYPQTQRLLSATPKIDFPMLKTYRGDYEPNA